MPVVWWVLVSLGVGAAGGAILGFRATDVAKWVVIGGVVYFVLTDGRVIKALAK